MNVKCKLSSVWFKKNFREEESTQFIHFHFKPMSHFIILMTHYNIYESLSYIK